MILLPLPRLVLPTAAPPFGWHECAVNEALCQVNLAARIQVFSQRVQNLDEYASLYPGLEVSVAG